MANLGDMVVKIVGDVTDFNKNIDAAQTRFNAATSNFQKIGKSLTTFVTLPILGIGAAAVKSAADMEMQQAAFETLLGSAEKAKVLLSDLTELAAKTPFQLTDLSEASKTMLSFGIALDDILPNVRMLGDIAQGDATKLKSLTLAFSQIQSTGRLMGQDLLQLINAGFNPLTIIAEKTGKTMAELKKEMERGAISAEQVSEAFKIATSEGGLFFNGMERASQTFSGQVSTLKDNVAALGRSIGDVLLPTLKDIVANISAWVQNFTKLDIETRKTIISMALIAAAIGPAILGILKLIQTVNTLKTVFAKFPVSANPYLLVLAAIVAAALAVAAAIKKAKTEQENLSKTLDRSGTVEQARAAIKAQQKNIEILQANRIAALTDEQIAKYDKEIAQAQQQLFILNQRLRDLQTLEEVERQRAEAAAKADAEEVARLQAEADALRQSIQTTETLTTATEEDTVATEENTTATEENTQAHDEWDTVVSKTLDKYKEKIELAQSVSKGFFETIGQDLANGELSWKSLATAAVNSIGNIVSALGDELAADAAAKLIKGFAALASIVTAPLAPGYFASAKILAAGAAAAYVAAGALKSAKFAEGGIVQPRPGGIQATVAEAGVAEAIIPLDKLDNMLANIGTGGGTTHLIVNLDSRPLLDKIFDATRNGTVLISSGAVV